MAEHAKSAVTRTVTISDLTPAEVASIFASWDNIQQAAFFDAVHEEARAWPGTGWCGQALSITDQIGPGGIAVIDALADHLTYIKQKDAA
jgi:hypothetical protein